MRHLLILPIALACLLALDATAQAETRQLTLSEALQFARSQSPVLKKAASQTDAASARSNGSRAKLLPQVVASGTWQHTTDNFVQRPGYSQNSARVPFVIVDADGVPTGALLQQIAQAKDPKWDFVDSYNFAITASQLVYDFSSIDVHRADKETTRSQVELERVALLQTEYSVRNAFFLARAQRELVSVAEQTLANQEKHLAQIQAFVEVGTRPEIDLAQVRTDLANARVSLLRAQTGYATAKENLKLVMGTPTSVDYEVNDDTLEPVPEEELALAELITRAGQTRPELAALSRQLRAQELRTRAAKGRMGPSVSLNASANKAGINLGQLTTNAYVGATASWNLLQSGGAFAVLREAQANERGIQADLSAQEQNIRVQLEQARLSIQAAKATLEASLEALTNARARLGLAEGRYEAGVGNAIELGDAQLALTSADAQRVQSEYNLAIARAQLLAALGKTL